MNQIIGNKINYTHMIRNSIYPTKKRGIIWLVISLLIFFAMAYAWIIVSIAGAAFLLIGIFVETITTVHAIATNTAHKSLLTNLLSDYEFYFNLIKILFSINMLCIYYGFLLIVASHKK